MEPGAQPIEPSPPGSRLRRALGALRASAAGRAIEVAGDNLHDPARVLGVVVVVAFVLRVIWLNLPPDSFVFDETYYVNASRVILGWPAGPHYADSPPGLDPNTEHPPLGKLLMAGSMAIFGDDGLGWRLPSVIAAMIALYAIYQIVRTLDRSAWLAVLVVALVAFDNLTFVHGRIGTLDILFLAPMLVGSWLALQQRWLLAGVAMAIALLIKLPALYGIGAVLLYVVLTDGPGWWRARRIPWREVRGPLAFVAVAVALALGGLWLLDARFTTFATPFAHIERMVSYGANLRAPISAGFCPEADSRPWQWLFNECQINYFRVDVNVRVGEALVSSRPAIDFRGALNPFLVGAIPLAALFTGWYAWRTGSRIALWTVAWAAANYLPFIVLALLTPRIMYIYYAVPLVPALAVGAALLVTRGGLPRPVRWAFLGLYLIGFAAYFPFRQIP